MTNIKEVIHLYLGCEVRAAEGSMTYTLSGIDRKGNALFYDEHGNEMWLPEGWKIAVRRLDSMTEEEGKDICMILSRTERCYNNILWLKRRLRENIPAKLFLYLLKQGFWLFGDEAFEQGLIIDKNSKH